MSGGPSPVNPLMTLPHSLPGTLPPTLPGTLLGGRVSYRQFADGNRTGIEPVLMAAFVPARPGQSILEGGCGAGAALLCLASRVPNILGVGIEHDAATAKLAQENICANRFHNLRAIQAQIPQLPSDIRHLLPHGVGRFDHIMANPPWHRDASTAPEHPRRKLARTASSDTLSNWIGCFRNWLQPGGTLTLALPAALTASAISALHDRKFGSLQIYPLWPHAGEAARLVLLQATADGRGDTAITPGLILHREDGKFTHTANAILRNGTAILKY